MASVKLFFQVHFHYFFNLNHAGIGECHGIPSWPCSCTCIIKSYNLYKHSIRLCSYNKWHFFVKYACNACTVNTLNILTYKKHCLTEFVTIHNGWSSHNVILMSYIEIISWKVRRTGFYSWVVCIIKRTSEVRASEFMIKTTSE